MNPTFERGEDEETSEKDIKPSNKIVSTNAIQDTNISKNSGKPAYEASAADVDRKSLSQVEEEKKNSEIRNELPD